MKKELGTIQALFPMPVLVIAAYDAKGTKGNDSVNERRLGADLRL